MKKIYSVILFLLSLFIFSCNKTYIGKKYDTKKYTIAEGNILEKFYTTDENKVIELPYIPYGFYLRYDKVLFDETTSNKKQLPLLGHQDHFGNTNEPILNVSTLVINEDEIYVRANDIFYEIKFNVPYNYKIVKDIKYDNSSTIFNFTEQYIKDYKITENCFSLQSNEQNREYHVNYSTPVINGIISLGLYDDKFYFGQTMYSYFILDLTTDKLLFFRDEYEFNNFCMNNI